MKNGMQNCCYILLVLLLAFSCKNNTITNLESGTGIIEDRPRIPISEKTQISLDFSTVQCSLMDTTLHFDKAVEDSLKKCLDIIKQNGRYKGLSVAVGIPGKGFWCETTGESGTDTPLTVTTTFHAQSLSKIFTAALALKLIEENYFKSSDIIKKWFPDCPRADEITIKDLLAHTSGIQTYECLQEFVTKDYNKYNELELVQMAFKYPIQDPPNTSLYYSNTEYIMLGIIIEKVLQSPLPDIFGSYYIEPLQLQNTLFCNEKNLQMNGIRGYHGDTLSGQTQWPLTYATGPFIATPTDILLAYNYILTGKFIADSTINEMFSDMNIWKLRPDSYYGKGIYVITNLPGGNYLGHSGGHQCFRTGLYYNIESKMFIAVFSNTDAFDIEPAIFKLSEDLMHYLDIDL